MIDKQILMQNFSVNLRSYMDREGMTILKIATLAEVTPMAVYNWLTMISLPRTENFLALSSETGIPIESWLQGGLT